MNKLVLSHLVQNDTYRRLPPEVQKIILERVKHKIVAKRRASELLEILRQRREAATQGRPRQ